MRRGIGQADWRRPYIAPFGQVFSAFGTVRGDLYAVEDGKQGRPPTDQKRGGGRFFPQAGLNFKWPFFNWLCDQNYIVQPVGELIGAPDKSIGVKSSRIPDEDSKDFELNDTNLFSPDRYPGYDRIDTGSRAIYGGEVLSTGKQFGDVSAFLGQSYSLSKPSRLDLIQGFGRRPSDYVGRIMASPFSWFDVNYRFRIDQKSLKVRVSEAGGAIGPAIAKLAANYVFLDKTSTANNKDFNQIALTLTSQITKYWSLVGQMRENLVNKADGGGPLMRGIGAIYRDECFGLGLTISRQYYRDRDVRPNTTLLMTLFLKNVGDFNYSLDLNQGVFGEKSDTPYTP